MVFAVLFCFGCGGSTSSGPSKPPPTPTEEPPAPTAEPPPPPEPEPTAEPTAEPDAPDLPPPTKSKPQAEPKCEDLERSNCVVTEGCEWHTIKKCLTQDKPKTLE